MVLLIGVRLRRELHVTQTTRGTQFFERWGTKLPFVHSDVSALEVILLKERCFLKGAAVSRDLHR